MSKGCFGGEDDMQKRAFSILLTAVLLFSFSLIVVAAEKPYVAEYLFCPGSISYYSYWTSDGEYLYCNDGGYGIYKVDIATGEYEDMDTKVSVIGRVVEKEKNLPGAFVVGHQDPGHDLPQDLHGKGVEKIAPVYVVGHRVPLRIGQDKFGF